MRIIDNIKNLIDRIKHTDKNEVMKFWTWILLGIFLIPYVVFGVISATFDLFCKPYLKLLKLNQKLNGVKKWD